MYRSLMLTLDGTAFADRAVEHARDVAVSCGARVILLDVVPEHRGPFPFTVEAARIVERREAEHHLQEVRERLLAGGVSQVDVMTVQSDSPAEAIVNAARRSQCDAVVMATHDRSGWRRLLEGSVAQSVAQRLKGMDVLLVRPEPVTA